MLLSELNLNTKVLKIKNNLHPEIWASDDKLKPEIREKLLEVVEKYKKFAGIENINIKDVVLTGSLANYNFSDLSDLDIHIVIDYNDLSNNKDFVMDYFLSKKDGWANEYHIKIKNFPMEIFVEDSENVNQDAARYSLISDEWVNRPNKDEISFDADIVKRKAKDLIRQIKDVIYYYGDLEVKLSRIDKLKEKIRNFRKSGLTSGGEFSNENLAFKVVRNTGFIDKLNDEKVKTVEKMLSLNENESFINEDLINSVNEDYPSSFDMDYFKSLKTFKDRVKYCSDNLQKIGSGSSRIVYKIDDEKVIKLAKNQKGIAQNEVEIQYSDYYDLDNILARVIDYHPDSLWNEMELAKKVTKSNFKQIAGLDFDEYATALKKHYLDMKGSRFSISVDKEFMELMWENDFSSTILGFISNYDVPAGDLGRTSSYGVVKRNGQDTIVLIDYGLTNDVYTTYYN